MNYLSYPVLGCVFCSFASFAVGEVTLFQESFETDGNGTRYTLIGGHDDGEDNYVARRPVGAEQPSGSAANGEWIFGFNDIDFAPIQARINGDRYDAEGLTVRQARIKFEGIDISGHGQLRVAIAAANFGGGNDLNDDLSLRVRFDGGDWLEIGGFKPSAPNSPPVFYAGPKNTFTSSDAPGQLSPTFRDHSWSIIGQGSTIDLEITVEGNGGNEDHHIDNVRIYGNPDVAFFTAEFENPALSEPSSGSISNPLTLALAAPAPDGGVTFAVTPMDADSAASVDIAPGATVTVPAGESSIEVPVEILQDRRYSGTKNVALLLTAEGYNPFVASLMLENVSLRPNVLITEILQFVPGVMNNADDLVGDANGDGISDGVEDRFVEIMNFESLPVDISGWMIWEEAMDVHLFPEGTVLNAGQAAVVFVGGQPTGGFGGAVVMTKSSGPTVPSLNIAYQPTFYLRAPFDAEVDRVENLPQRADYLFVTEDSERVPEWHLGHGKTASLHRLGTESETLDLLSVFDEHIHSLIQNADERLFSPGTWYDGAVWTGTGWTRLPLVFTAILHSAGGGWFWDSTYGWLYTGAPDWDLPWVYVADREGYWYIYEDSISDDGMWAYDHGLSSWCYSAYAVYPWVWQDSAAVWVLLAQSS